MKIYMLILCSLFALDVRAKEVRTNEVTMVNAPKWVTRNKVEKVTNKIQRDLEWTTRRVKVFWYKTERQFSKAQNLGPQVNAVTKLFNGKQTVHLSPRVTEENFNRIFSHEMVHVIINQKYKGAIPRWFEEGLANHLSKAKRVNYKWLAKQRPVDDVYLLAHPFGGSKNRVTYLYKASQALAEMLAKGCNLMQLIQLSVQRKMEDYIKTYCEIKDLNSAFADWVKRKSKQVVRVQNKLKKPVRKK